MLHFKKWRNNIWLLKITFQFLAKSFYVSHKFANKIKLKLHSAAKLNV